MVISRMVNGIRADVPTLRRVAWLLAGIAVVAAWLASPARAADTIYWTNFSANSISFANLDGSGGGGTLTTTGATAPNQPVGVAIDPAAGRIYWGNAGSGKISYANLDNTGGGGDLNTTGATTLGVRGLAIDPSAGRVYWANTVGAGAISRANLDNTGGADLSTSGATLANPAGIAIDPGSNRIWWANRNTTTGNKISAANLDGSGSGVDLPITSGTLSGPWGVAVNPVSGKIYWSNQVIGSDPQKVSFADLDGSDGADLNTAGSCAVCSPVNGLAFDPDVNRLFFSNAFTTAISFANLDGSGGGGNLGTSGAPASDPTFVAILKRPSPVAPPSVSGGAVTGSGLSCSQGGWAPNVLGGHLYRAPRTFTYQWTVNGSEIAGAASPQTSSAHQVADLPPAPPKKCKKGRKLKKGKCVKKKKRKKR